MSQTSLTDVLSYLTYANPLSQAVLKTTVEVAKGTFELFQHNLISKTVVTPQPPAKLPLSDYVGSHNNFIRLAGLSGAAAIILSVYGKTYIETIQDPKQYAEATAIFDAANRFHFVHTCALIAVPLTRRPVLTGSFMIIGTAALSGSLYYRSLTGDKRLRHVATCGGLCIIAAWLSLLF